MEKLCRIFALTTIVGVFMAPTLYAKTWFVRTDGGTRYSSGLRNGQCDGLRDAPYPGTGVNQHCAFNDVRYMWLTGEYGNSAWVMVGGDTLVIRGCAALPSQQHKDAPHCRIGGDKATGNDAQNFWCAGVSDPANCSMPPPPSGTPAQHTRILGQCAYGNYTCNPVDKYPYYSNNLTQIFGGFSIPEVISLAGSKYVDLVGLEITSHDGTCTRVGSTPTPPQCSTSSPLSDFASWGIVTTDTTSNITLQDVYIHGLAGSGIQGPIGGPWTLTRVSIDFNAFAGWNFDDGRSTPDGPGSSITASYVTMEGNGCMEEYPIMHPQFPALSCWDPSSGGFGDSWSGQNAKLISFLCDHCVMAYNTKDGFIGPHTQISNLRITNSESYGNMGQQWKWGASQGSTTVFENNLTIGNCRRMSEPMSGARPDYNRYLSNFCRAAGDIFAFYTAANSTVLFQDDTSIGYSATMFDLSCRAPSECGSAHFIFRNNIVLGFLNPRNNPPEPPGLFYFSDQSVKLEQDHNLYYNMRTKPCPFFGRSDLICASPSLVNQPPLTLTSESQLDRFNFHPEHGSVVAGHGIPVSEITKDFFGILRPNPPSIGAVEADR